MHPTNTFIVTGISRSGTSLTVALLNTLPGVVCFNEVLPKHPNALTEAFDQTRQALLSGLPVTNKYLGDTLTTDTLIDGVEKRKHTIDLNGHNTIHLGSKRNLSYLNALPELLALNCPIIAMIRDPLYTLASWGSEKALRAGIPGSRVLDHNLHPHLQHIQFTSDDPIVRRAHIWEHYAQRLWQHRHQLTIIPYEWLCQRPQLTLTMLANTLNVTTTAPLDVHVVSNARNDPSRYTQDLTPIQRAITTHCPTRLMFGYTTPLAHPAGPLT